MDENLKSYLDKQFAHIRSKLEEHDRQFIKIDEHFDSLIESVNAGLKNFNDVQREVGVIKENIREKLGVEI
ncbi:MAG: hypothetical protein A2931_00260 [Candidatus Niyogibacteria bacterium RIFCSPLOWO2_01_FULL_45_48]|uniref:Uncharacterized protein n=2 Tax=Candidatus Niyogiibacteriota TaxID=1817912 RepID=A0A1G2EYY5_9BACT|nr:MAG: hypothetical protein A2931_00260 [Candidatus Niyogibacteria bacterium RIFCSPLOWO2_01_FULL_45_48]OGZ30571.1 MAG: hypothetical protein A3J00_03830 [Candidatus Niyogibacteria bacterium RIFCSPLOWO2_02_FULL_45_13]